jgi:two-component system, LytTR family, sensor kinase
MNLHPDTPFLFGIRQRLTFLAIWLVWTFVHVCMLLITGFTFEQSWKQGLVHNGLLLGAALVLLTIFRYYSPVNDRLVRYSVIVISIWIGWVLFLQWLQEISRIDHTNGYEYTKNAGRALSILSGLLFLFISTLVNEVWNVGLLRQTDEWYRRETERQHKEAELMHLREQLNPHFLFNSLNSIHTLIGQDKDRARQMTIQLADFLRGTIQTSPLVWTSLDIEIRQVERYLAIEKCRLGDRLQLSVEVAPGTENGRLPGLILQPLVENAVKHGWENSSGMITLHISTSWEGNTLQVKVSNLVSTEIRNNGHGFGLEYVERRLFLIFGRSGLLIRERNDDHFIITLNIPQIA